MSLSLKYVTTECTNPDINLAMEEYMTFNAGDDEVILYIWQNAHTVVIGKNQNPWSECNITQMETDNCILARRISGGGAVYHDLGNVNFTFIAKKSDYNIPKQTDTILEAVKSLGIDAVKNGRNDLTIDGMKFSGHAYFQKGDYCYHHGTIMMNVDHNMMSKYLNVSKDKLKSKGVSSVKSRVCNLIDYNKNINLEMLKKALINAFGKVYAGNPQEISLPEMSVIADTISKYKDYNWKYGRKIPFTLELKNRFPWGNAEIQLLINEGTVKDCQIFSDSLNTEAFKIISNALIGTLYNRDSLKDINFDSDFLGKEIFDDIIDLIINNLK